MLTPRYLESAPDAMVDLYSEVEADILADMARRIARYDFFIPAAEHQLRVLEEMGAEQTYILRRLAELTGRSEAELRQLFEVSGGEGPVSDQADYRRAGLHPPGPQHVPGAPAGAQRRASADPGPLYQPDPHHGAGQRGAVSGGAGTGRGSR